MNLTSAILSILILSSTAFAVPILPSESVRNQRLPGGLGFDKEIVQLHADTDDFDRGVYYLRINVRERRLENYRLPRSTFTQYCGYYRRDGGSIGDYKPKSVYNRIFIRNITTGRLETLAAEGILDADYNETPVVRSYEYHPRGNRLTVPSRSAQMDILIHACKRVRPVPTVSLIWDGYTKCRWKPEIWHKPSLFREEYDPRLGATIHQPTVLHCVNF